jgi:N-acetylglucosamine kinase-like BadF-type ATPase
MILIADSGSTKTDWLGLNKDTVAYQGQTIGLNPVLLSIEQIRQHVAKEFPRDFRFEDVRELHFYGSGGGSAERRQTVFRALEMKFPRAGIRVEHDLTGAARATCGTEPGIVCILGTGANCGLYDGNLIREHMFSLGYLLGDEGAGVDLGKRLVRDRYYGRLPSELAHAFDRFFLELTGGVPQNIVDAVYRADSPPRFLASFVPFLYDRKENETVRSLVREAFRSFLTYHVIPYPQAGSLPIHFVGSVSCLFKDILEELLDEYRLHSGEWVQRPILALARYHTKQKNEKQK